MPNITQRRAKNGAMRGHRVIVQKASLAGHRANLEIAVVAGHTGHFTDRVEVDQMIDDDIAEIHHRH